jgi:hypothetical protein
MPFKHISLALNWTFLKFFPKQTLQELLTNAFSPIQLTLVYFKIYIYEACLPEQINVLLRDDKLGLQELICANKFGN